MLQQVVLARLKDEAVLTTENPEGAIILSVYMMKRKIYRGGRERPFLYSSGRAGQRKSGVPVADTLNLYRNALYLKYAKFKRGEPKRERCPLNLKDLIRFLFIFNSKLDFFLEICKVIHCI